jgi:hypothetical protein
MAWDGKCRREGCDKPGKKGEQIGFCRAHYEELHEKVAHRREALEAREAAMSPKDRLRRDKENEAWAYAQVAPILDPLDRWIEAVENEPEDDDDAAD